MCFQTERFTGFVCFAARKASILESLITSFVEDKYE